MLYRLLLIFISLFLVIPSGNSKETTEPKKYDKIGFGVSFTPWNKSRKEIGYGAGAIYSGIYFVESDGVWKNGKPASMSIRVKQDELDEIIEQITKKFSGIKPVFTYSEWKAKAPRNPSLGMYTTDLFRIIQKQHHFAIRFTTREGNYYRSKWLIFKDKDFNASIFKRLRECVAKNKKAVKMVDGVELYWQKNK